MYFHTFRTLGSARGKEPFKYGSVQVATNQGGGPRQTHCALRNRPRSKMLRRRQSATSSALPRSKVLRRRQFVASSALPRSKVLRRRQFVASSVLPRSKMLRRRQYVTPSALSRSKMLSALPDSGMSRKRWLRNNLISPSSPDSTKCLR